MPKILMKEKKNMNIKRAKQEIKDSIEAYLTKDNYGEYKIPSIRQRPILLMGPPGIGKTQIMEQIARECEIGLVAYTITHHTRQSAIGLPFIREKEYSGQTYSVTEYTMSEIIASVYEKIEQTGNKEGILFIDEINCVSETLAPTMLQFLQCKMFGNQKVPDGWIIVAAGNPPEYNKSVRDFDVVTLDRMKKIDVEADYISLAMFMSCSSLSYVLLRLNRRLQTESTAPVHLLYSGITMSLPFRRKLSAQILKTHDKKLLSETNFSSGHSGWYSELRHQPVEILCCNLC